MTDPTRRILVPVDFGPASARAVQVAGSLSSRWPASLTLLHAEALEAPAYFTHEQVESLSAQRTQLRSQAESFLKQFGRRHTNAAFTTKVVSGAPTPAILDEAVDADLVVMGTHGRHGPTLWWLGSVTERVLRDGDKPLLVVHADDDPASMFGRVCIYAEPPATGTAALALATELAGPQAVTDGRSGPVCENAADGATLIVVAAAHVGDRIARSRIAVSRIRTRAGSVLIVPE